MLVPGLSLLSSDVYRPAKYSFASGLRCADPVLQELQDIFHWDLLGFLFVPALVLGLVLLQTPLTDHDAVGNTDQLMVGKQ